MKPAEIKNKSEKELRVLLKGNRDKLRQLRFGLTLGKVKNVREMRSLKRDIAQILTILNPKNKSKK
jgi:large subunit ribosomal protein L29